MVRKNDPVSRKGLVLALLFVGASCLASAQSISLLTCLDSAQAAMPLLRQKPMMMEVLRNKLNNYQTAYLPSLTLNAQASYQSDVPDLPFSAPGAPEINIPRDQYKAWMDVSAPIYDGGITRAQQKMETASNETSLRSLDVGLNEYKKQVVQSYFQTLLAARQHDIIVEVIDLLNEKQKSVEAALANGVLQENDLLRLKAEIRSQEKKRDALEHAYSGGIEVLSILTGMDLEGRTLEIPEIAAVGVNEIPASPELMLIDAQRQRIAAGSAMLRAQRMPRLSLFGQVGMGQPNPFNFFEEDASLFYISGIRATWTLFDWNKTSREKSNLLLNIQMLDLQKQQNMLEIDSRITHLQSERTTYADMVQKDEDIIALRKNIRRNASRQLDEGVITSTDFLDEVLAEQEAEIAKNVDQISLYRSDALIKLELGQSIN